MTARRSRIAAVARHAVVTLSLSGAAAAVAAPGILHVTAPSGEGVAEARVTLLEVPGDDGRPVVVTADAGGRAEILQGSDTLACVTAPGHAARLVLVPPPDGRTTVALEGEVRVRGRVTDTAGTAIVGAAVGVDPVSPFAACVLGTTTDEAGDHALGGLPRDGPEIRISTGGSHLAVQRAVVPDASGTARLDVALHPACHVLLTVRDARAEAVDGAAVEVVPGWRPGDFASSVPATAIEAIDTFEGRTAADGSLLLPALPRGPTFRIAARAAGHAPTSVEVKADALTVDAALSLRRGGTVRLRTVDADGTPWPEPEATVHADDVPDVDLLDAFAGGADGELLIGPVAAGRVTLEIRAPGAAPRRLAGVVVTDGTETDAGDVTLAEGGGLAGTVVDERGDRVPGAEITVVAWLHGRPRELEATSDADGSFSVDGLPTASRADLTVRKAGYREEELPRVPVGGEDVVVTLRRAGTLVLRVEDRRTGEPVGGFRATALREGRRFRDPGQTVDGAEGEATFPDLRSGSYRVRVDSPGHAPFVSDLLDVVEGDATEVEVALDRGHELAGTVRNAADGEPVPGAEVVARLADGIERRTVSDEEGLFRLAGLAGQADLHARRGDLRSPRLHLSRAAEHDEVELVLRAAGRVEGFVLDGSGAPLAGAEIRAEGEDRAVLSGPDGAYVLRGLRAGRLRLRKVNEPETLRGLEVALVTVRPGSVTRRDFGAGVRLHGSVRFRGEPVAEAELSLAPGAGVDGPLLAGGIAHATRSDDAGHYEIVGLAAGQWILRSSWQGRAYLREVTIPEDTPALRHDVEVPDLRLGGAVRDADGGRPLAGVSVRAWQADVTASIMGITREDGSMSFVEPPVMAEDVTGPDGAFELLLPAPGRYRVVARADERVDDHPGAEWIGEVLTSRSDLPLELSSTAELRVTVVDADSGLPLSGVHAWLVPGDRDPLVRTEPGGVHVLRVPTGRAMTLLLGRVGRAPAVRGGIDMAPGSSEELEVRLARGGDLRLLVPDGALSRGVGTLHGGLHLVSGENDLMAWHTTHALVAQNAARLGPGDWRLAHLPSGDLRVSLGDADAEVTVRPGEETVVDLR